ncbi:hypothetical protein FACS1894126_5200 [Alphaproteobacteria bacterium]|nr:hypothetical protein FACS1894126_5200 [Alphaproteobacteria bacterium]
MFGPGLNIGAFELRFCTAGRGLFDKLDDALEKLLMLDELDEGDDELPLLEELDDSVLSNACVNGLTDSMKTANVDLSASVAPH